MHYEKQPYIPFLFIMIRRLIYCKVPCFNVITMPCFSTRTVPDALRTKYEPDVEKEEASYAKSAAKLSSEEAQVLNIYSFRIFKLYYIIQILWTTHIEDSIQLLSGVVLLFVFDELIAAVKLLLF